MHICSEGVTKANKTWTIQRNIPWKPICNICLIHFPKNSTCLILWAKHTNIYWIFSFSHPKDTSHYYDKSIWSVTVALILTKKVYKPASTVCRCSLEIGLIFVADRNDLRSNERQFQSQPYVCSLLMIESIFIHMLLHN